MASLRPCREDERVEILEIVNEAADAYRGVIPEDRWRVPYMSEAELGRALASGVKLWGGDIRRAEWRGGASYHHQG